MAVPQLFIASIHVYVTFIIPYTLRSTWMSLLQSKTNYKCVHIVKQTAIGLAWYISCCSIIQGFMFTSALYLAHFRSWVIIVLSLPVVALLLLCCVDSIAVSLFVEFDKY